MSSRTRKASATRPPPCDKLLDGEQPPRRPILVEPLGVVKAVDRRGGTRRRRRRRRHALHPRARLRRNPGGRRRSARKSPAAARTPLRQLLGRSPKAEILRVQLDRVKQLLETPSIRWQKSPRYPGSTTGVDVHMFQTHYRANARPVPRRTRASLIFPSAPLQRSKPRGRHQARGGPAGHRRTDHARGGSTIPAGRGWRAAAPIEQR